MGLGDGVALGHGAVLLRDSASCGGRVRVAFRVDGIPAPKGSRVPGRRKNGTIYTRESSKKAGPWMEQIALLARVARPLGQALRPPYVITLTFTMPKPKKPKYPWPSKDGDLDKLCRACLDGLTQGGLIVDDRHVVALSLRKRFSENLSEVGVDVSIL